MPKKKKNNSNKRKKARVRNEQLPIPFRSGAQVFSPGKTTVLLHKDESFGSELQSLTLHDVVNDNSYELAWALSAYSFYKVEKVQIVVYPNHSRSRCSILFSWFPINFDNAGQFIQSDNVKMVLSPTWKPTVFTYYPVNAVINSGNVALNYKDWISTDNGSFPGVIYYLNDGGIDNFRVQVLLRFQGSRAPLLSILVKNLKKVELKRNGISA